jgi:UDP-glucose 4-epimerase
MDMVHVRDVARANILSAVAPVSDVALNIGSGTETSLLDLARLLCRVMGHPQFVPLHQEARAVNPVPRRLANVSKARELIGFEATHSLEKGIAELVAWWRSETVLAGAAA